VLKPDKISKRHLNLANKHRLTDCPCPDDCVSVTYKIDDEGCGHCVGLLKEPEDLDYIATCQWYWGDDKKLQLSSIVSMPDEVLEYIGDLSKAVETILLSNTDYMKCHQKTVLNKRK
jgi:hypothetical protein